MSLYYNRFAPGTAESARIRWRDDDGKS